MGKILIHPIKFWGDYVEIWKRNFPEISWKCWRNLEKIFERLGETWIKYQRPFSKFSLFVSILESKYQNSVIAIKMKLFPHHLLVHFPASKVNYLYSNRSIRPRMVSKQRNSFRLAYLLSDNPRRRQTRNRLERISRDVDTSCFFFLQTCKPNRKIKFPIF